MSSDGKPGLTAPNPPPRPSGRGGRRFITLLAGCLALMLPRNSAAQEATQATATIDTTISAGEADAQAPVPRGLAKYNSHDFGFTTFRWGYGFLVDFATYRQSDVAKQQVKTESDAGLRDFRIILKGKFRTERPLSWTFGYMYDGATKDWFFRQTGIMVGVPEIKSEFFVGRTKLGYSQYKVMVGYDIWTIERSPFLDAFVPILGDGIKWTGRAPKYNLLWNLGWFTDKLAETEKFATSDHEVDARVAWLPVIGETNANLVHVAVMGRVLKPDEGKFQAKSKPESYLAPNFVDTGKFSTDHATTFGVEAYYRHDSWLFGGEYGWENFDAPTVGDPMFHGGNLSATWLVTGEIRGYNRASGFFKAVSPKRTVFEGGPGAVELGMNYSYIDLDSGTLHGGKFWRLSPVAKWHLMDYMRVELAYGYGTLDRFDKKGTTNFFQARLLTAL